MNSTLTTFNQLNLLYQEQKKTWAQQLGLKLSQINILMLVEPQQVQISHAMLITDTKLDASTLSRQLHVMMQDGLLVKIKGSAPRQRLYALTDKAQQVIERLRIWQSELEQQIQDNWSADEQQLLKILLNRYYQSFMRLKK